MKKGFTIVETLVAITVLMIAISGPLTVSFRALNAAVASRDQMTASFLAQEGMEYVRNVKDNNYINGADEGWLQSIGECAPSSMCNLDTVTNTLKKQCSSFTDTHCRLYRTSANKFTLNQNANNMPTPFYRTIYLHNHQSSDEGDSVEVVVDVIWTTGSYERASTTLRSTFYDIAK